MISWHTNGFLTVDQVRLVGTDQADQVRLVGTDQADKVPADQPLHIVIRSEGNLALVILT